MPLNKIGFSKTFHLGENNFEKYWAEGELSNGETIDQLDQEARNHVMNSFLKQHPQFTKEQIMAATFLEDLPTIQIEK